jgi:hypothetical protein
MEFEAMVVTGTDERIAIAPPASRRRSVRRGTPSATARFERGSVAEPRRRNPVWLAGGLLLVVVCALLGALLFSAVDERRAVLVAAHDLAPGVPVSRGSFDVAHVAAEANVSVIEPRLVEAIIGRMPAGPIPTGTVISEGLFAGAIPLEASESVVGFALEPGEAPTLTLEAGTRLDLVELSSPPPEDFDAGESTARSIGVGVVWEATSLDSGQMLLSVRADRTVALAASAASADDRLRIVLIGTDR